VQLLGKVNILIERADGALRGNDLALILFACRIKQRSTKRSMIIGSSG
jgi:hypothetical protein